MNAGRFIHLDHQSSHYRPNLRPGDHVLWKTDGKTRTAVVKVVHPSQRVATLVLTDGPGSVPEIQTVSLLELDPHGTYDIMTGDSTPSPEELGVHRGEFVFIHKEGTTNGSVMPRVPKIGELEGWIQDVPSLYTMQPGGFTDVIYAEGLKVVMTEENWRDGRSTTFVPAGVPVRPIHWFGYVSDVGPLWFRTPFSEIWRLGLITSPQLYTDGQIEVSLPHGEKILVPLQRLTRLYDGLDQLEDMFEGGFSEGGSSMEDILPGGEEWLDGPDPGIPWLPPQLMWTDHRIDTGGRADTGKADTSTNQEGEIFGAMTSEVTYTHMDLSELVPPRLPGGLPTDDASTTPQISTTPVPDGPWNPALTSQPREQLRGSENDDLYWKRFEVLPSAPTDHAFYDRPIPQSSRVFMARLHKEYRALSTGLPGALALVSATSSNARFLVSLNPRTGI